MNSSHLVVLSGALSTAAMLVFLDGLIVAKRLEKPYNFLMWIPQILSLCGIFLMMFVKTEYISSNVIEEDENEEMKAKGLFFFGCAFLVGSLFAALWNLSDTYVDGLNIWPGIALVLQSLLFICCNCAIFAVKYSSTEEEE